MPQGIDTGEERCLEKRASGDERDSCLESRAVGFRRRREGARKMGNEDPELQGLNNGEGILESTRDEDLQERPRSGSP